MGNMSVNKPSGYSNPQSLAHSDVLKPGQGQKVHAPKMIQTPEETEQAFKKLGEFLKNSLDELRKMTFGDSVAPALAAPASGSTIGFFAADSAKALTDAGEFLKIHEQASRLD